MPGYTFKTYIYNGREYYEYDAVPTDQDEYAEPALKKTPVLVKKDFLFPESLLATPHNSPVKSKTANHEMVDHRIISKIHCTGNLQ